jgi:hypothetical protein
VKNSNWGGVLAEPFPGTVTQGVILVFVIVNSQLKVLSWIISTHDNQLEPYWVRLQLASIFASVENDEKLSGGELYLLLTAHEYSTFLETAGYYYQPTCLLGEAIVHAATTPNDARLHRCWRQTNAQSSC